MRIAIVWESIPEDTCIYVVDVTEKEWEWMQKTHLHFVNQVNEPPECMQLNLWLDRKDVQKKRVQSTMESWQKNNKDKLPLAPISMAGIDHMIVTGFMM